jgi:hypothetical protein
MSDASNRNQAGLFDRRRFCFAAGATALASAGAANAEEDDKCGQTEAVFQTGNGEWTYRIVPDWGKLPAGTSFGGTHGGIAADKAGRIYVSTQSETGVLMYSPEGRLLKTIAGEYPEIHSIVLVENKSPENNGEEEFYCTVQKGTPKENWLFLRMRTDGTVIQKITAPPEAGFKEPNEWKLTAAVPAPDGSIFIANGYGDSRLFRFDSKGNFKASYGGKGSADGLFNCSHGMAIDTRYDQPLLLICDRENRRLCHFDFDGKFVRTVTEHLRRPCQIGFYGDYAVVSELEGRVVVLDRDNAPVAFLGDNSRREQWANYTIDPSTISAVTFSAAHGCFIDRQASIYISDWNRTGRITKLIRKQA